MTGTSSPRGSLFAALALAVALGGCNKDEETVWVQFNAEDDVLEVDITTSEDLGDARDIELRSTSTAVVIGAAMVSPGSGPVGTDHEITVDVDDDWEDLVGRVTVRTDSPDRGVDEYELQRDSADHGHWWVELTSVGTDGEERTDVLTIRLWEEVPEGDVPSTVEETTASE